MIPPLDRDLWITTFPDLKAEGCTSQYISLNAFAEQLRNTRAPTKQELPLFSLCSFDRKRTGKNALRHDGNVRECFAVVGDYDGEKTSLADAADALRRARVCGLLVTTPRYTPATPRFRVVAPFSDPLHRARPNAAGVSLADYPKLVSRLAGVFPDGLAAESWTLSQSWYLGTVEGASDHGTLAIEDGDYLDRRPDLDAAARPKPKQVEKPRAAEPRHKSNSAETPLLDAPAEDNLPLDVAAALDAIAAGTGSHDALVALAGRWAACGLPRKDMQAALASALQRRPDDQRDEGWHKALADLPRLIAWVGQREAETAAPGSAPPPPPPPPPGNTGTAGPGAAAPGPQPSPPPSPPRTILRNKRPKNAGNLANVITLVLQAPELAGCVAFDEMAVACELRRPLPGDSTVSKTRPWTDDDTSRLQDWLQRNWDLARLGRETVQQGVDHVARLHAFHPVRDYLDSLTWDGTPRLDTWLHAYLGVSDSKYATATGRMWLLGMVARIMRPGCKFDYMLILEGLQGTQKSLVCSVLCAPWVSDQSLDIRHDARAASQHLRGKWLVEVSELTFFRSADVETLKAFISPTHERYLPRYAHNEGTEARQCGFLGTTNNETYLCDPTGARRFWPHRTGEIAIPLLRRDRDQVWAEAVHAYRAGEDWWPTADLERSVIQEEQLARYAADAWIEPVERELARRAKQAADERNRIQWTPACGLVRPTARGSLLDIWQAAFADPSRPDSDLIHPVRFDRSAQSRVRDVLLRLGWRRGKLLHGTVQWEEPQ